MDANHVLQTFFERKPDFVVSPSFWGGSDPVVQLANYQAEVRKHAPFEILSKKMVSSYYVKSPGDSFDLHLVVPAHCGYKECSASISDHTHRIEDWGPLAADVVNQIKIMHKWVGLAFPDVGAPAASV